MRREALIIGATLALWLALPAGAAAQQIPCSPVQRGGITLDGLLGDWKGAKGVGVDDEAQIISGTKDWTGADDLSFDLFCNHTETTLYLAIMVHDEYFVRSKKGRGDDHIRLRLGRRELRIYPGDLRKIKARLQWRGKGRKRRVNKAHVRMAEAMQRDGYSVELALVMDQIPGFRVGSPSFSGSVSVADCDSRAKGRTQTVISTARPGRGSFVFARASAALDGFLKARGFKASQIRFNKVADVVGDKRMERVVLVGRTIGIVGDGLPQGGFFYVDLPPRRAKDVYWLKLVDLNGDGKVELVTRFVQRSKSGRRELIAVYRYNDSNRFMRSFAHEILKGQKKRIILNRYAFKVRKKRRKVLGVDLVFDKPEARGFTKEAYKEVPATDVQPIMLPWGEEKKRHFRFEGEEYSQQ